MSRLSVQAQQAISDSKDFFLEHEFDPRETRNSSLQAEAAVDITLGQLTDDDIADLLMGMAELHMQKAGGGGDPEWSKSMRRIVKDLIAAGVKHDIGLREYQNMVYARTEACLSPEAKHMAE